MATVKVALVGASGETGQSIVNGLLECKDTNYELYALVRPASITKPANLELMGRGVKLIPMPLTAPQDDLVSILTGIDVVISTIHTASLDEEIPLADAAKRAGVKRFIPSGWASVAPPAGVLVAREMKEKIWNHVLMLDLPYTFIDVGWWYEASLPPVPSGRLDYCVAPVLSATFPLGLDGSVPSALTSLADVGRWVARIIGDPRTLNKKVFAYNEVLTRGQVYDVLEKCSGEELTREYLSEEEAKQRIQTYTEEAKRNPTDIRALFAVGMSQYFYSFGIRGDNRPQYAKYLGYLDCKELYPEMSYKPFDEFVQEALDGKAKGVLMGY